MLDAPRELLARVALPPAPEAPLRALPLELAVVLGDTLRLPTRSPPPAPPEAPVRFVPALAPPLPVARFAAPAPPLVRFAPTLPAERLPAPDCCLAPAWPWFGRVPLAC